MGERGFDKALDFLSSWLPYRFRQSDLPGLCVAILYKDSIVFSQAYGLANAEFSVPLTTHHIFSMASQSKMFTSIAVLQLASQGKFRVTDKVSDHLPWLRKRDAKQLSNVTIQQLLNHSSGLAHDAADSRFWDLREPFPGTAKIRSEILAANITVLPDNTPKYSNLGYCVLGELIAHCSGQAYTSYVEEHIIKPLQLHSTYADFKPNMASLMPTGYSSPYNHRRARLEPRRSTKAMAAGVGIHSTPEDMCRFAASQFFGTKTLLSDARKRYAQQTQASITKGLDVGVTFGLGFRVKSFDNRQLFGHDGHLAGHVSATFFDPRAKLAVAIATNAQDTPVMQIVNGIFGALRWFSLNGLRPRRESRYGGRLRNLTGSLQIVTKGNRIVSLDPDSWTPFDRLEEMRPVQPDMLQITTPGSLVNTGELVTYQFTNDITQAVNYAGIHMLPEATYQGKELDNITPSLEQHWLSLEELQYATLKIGRVVKAETWRGLFRYRLLVDYGPDFGIRYAFLKSLPPNVSRSILLHKLVIGAVFTVWNFGSKSKEVLALGLGLGQRLSLPFMASEMLILQANPAHPRTMWASAARAQNRLYADELRYGGFKFQALPEYDQDECDSAYGDSLYAWLAGKVNRSKALLKLERKEFWHDDRLRSTRVIVTENEPSAYQLWSIEFARRVGIARGELVYTLPRRALQGLRVPEGDFTIWDDQRVTLNGYSGSHWTHSTVYDSIAEADIKNFLSLKQKLLSISQQLGQRLSAGDY